MLIKTDDVNYTNIANSIRDLTGTVLTDQTITTELVEDDESGVSMSLCAYTPLWLNSSINVGDTLSITFNGVNYVCVITSINNDGYIYMGNISLYGIPFLTSLANKFDQTLEEYLADYPDQLALVNDSEEPFVLCLDNINSGDWNFVTKEPGTYDFKVKQLTNTTKYKPAEMVDALNGYFPDYGVSFNSDGTVATTFGRYVVGFTYNTTVETVNISDNAIEICDRAFEYTNLTSMILPESITRISKWAFFCSRKLETINLPNSIDVIDSYAFYGCSALTDITLPNNITRIGQDAFNGCKKINISSVPETVSRIAFGLFEGCTSITNFVFHKNISIISDYVFNGCSALTTITFEGTPESIEDKAFTSCSNLTTINVPWSEGEVANAPWGATNATINYNYVVE